MSAAMPTFAELRHCSRHVIGAPRRGSRAGRVASGALFHGTRQPKVDQPNAKRRLEQENVLRLQIAVDEAALVNGLHRGENRLSATGKRSELERELLRNHRLAEGRGADELQGCISGAVGEK